MDVNKLHVSVSLYIPVINLFCSFMIPQDKFCEHNNDNFTIIYYMVLY